MAESEQFIMAWRGAENANRRGESPIDDLALTNPFEGLPNLPPGIRRAAVAGR